MGEQHVDLFQLFQEAPGQETPGTKREKMAMELQFLQFTLRALSPPAELLWWSVANGRHV